MRGWSSHWHRNGAPFDEWLSRAISVDVTGVVNCPFRLDLVRGARGKDPAAIGFADLGYGDDIFHVQSGLELGREQIEPNGLRLADLLSLRLLGRFLLIGGRHTDSARVLSDGRRRHLVVIFEHGLGDLVGFNFSGSVRLRDLQLRLRRGRCGTLLHGVSQLVR